MPFYCLFWCLQTPAGLKNMLPVPSFILLIKRLNQVKLDTSSSKWSLDTSHQQDTVVMVLRVSKY